jgi:hypothetical protein
MITAISAVDELMQHCKQIGLRRSRLMSRFYRFHRHNPALLDFLLQELVTLRNSDSWRTTSFEMLWHHARWVLTYHRVPGETFAVCQNFMPYYSRLAIILFPDEFNGFYRLKKAKADSDFGVRIAPARDGGLRRLEWADGTPLSSGWGPSVPYIIPTVPVPRRPPVQRAQGVSHD